MWHLSLSASPPTKSCPSSAIRCAAASPPRRCPGPRESKWRFSRISTSSRPPSYHRIPPESNGRAEHSISSIGRMLIHSFPLRFFFTLRALYSVFTVFSAHKPPKCVVFDLFLVPTLWALAFLSKWQGDRQYHVFVYSFRQAYPPSPSSRPTSRHGIPS